MGYNRTGPARADPSKPPRPRNAWMLFLCAYHQERNSKRELNLPVENETRPHAKVVSQMWKALSDEERGKWVKAAEREKEAHARLYPEYKYRPSKAPRRISFITSALSTPSRTTYPSVTNARSDSTASKPKNRALGQTPVQWDVPQAAKKAKIRQAHIQHQSVPHTTPQYAPAPRQSVQQYASAPTLAPAHAQHQSVPSTMPLYAPAPRRYAQQYVLAPTPAPAHAQHQSVPSTTPLYAPAPRRYAQQYVLAPTPAPAPEARRERPPRAKQEVIEEDIDNLELIDGQLVLKASGSTVDDEDSENEDEGHAGSAYSHQYTRHGYASEDSKSEDEVPSQVPSPTPTQDDPVALKASSEPIAPDTTFVLRPAIW